MLENEPLFRKLTVADLDEVCHLEVLSFSRPWSKASYRHELAENEMANFFGLFDGEKLIAFAGYWLIVDEGHIANVAVHPAYRRQGCGELLMRRIIVDCQAKGGKKMTLEVRKRNFPARDMYYKLGFEKKGERPRYYQDPQDDALIMWLDLEHTEEKEEKEEA